MWPHNHDEQEQCEHWHAYCTLEKCNNANNDDNDNAIVVAAVAATANSNIANADDERNK